MKHKLMILVLGLVIILGLAACGQDAGQSTGSAAADSSDSAASNTTENSSAGQEQDQTIVAELGDDFDNALSKTSQLALGTLQLEDGDLAVSEAQAAELLPLWQALQSLSNSETTAQVELDAVAKQIQATMSAEQVATIAQMKLSEDDLSTMVENGELGFRGLGGRNAGTTGEDSAVPHGGFAGGPGGDFGPRGGGQGGGQGGGPGGGMGPGFGGELSEDDIATRQAQFAGSDLGDMSDQLLIGAVVRLMQTKTGEAPTDPGSLFNTVFELVADETGLSVDEIQAALAGGQSLEEIIVANGGDVESVRAAMIDAFETLPNAEQFDAAERADLWLKQQSGQQ